MPPLEVIQLIEALQSTTIRRRRGLAERRLAPKVARFFQLQKRAYLQSFATLAGEFREVEGSRLDGLFNVSVKALSTVFALTFQEEAETLILLGAANVIASYGLDISFDLENPLAVAFLKNYGAELVKNINEETRSQLKNLILAEATKGSSYTRIAKLIRERFDGFSGRSPQKHIRSRAELVAVTEVGKAYSFGNYAAVKSAEANGIVFEKSWVTVGDKRVSDGCAANQREGWIALDKDFSSGELISPRFPGCRCAIVYRRKPD